MHEIDNSFSRICTNSISAFTVVICAEMIFGLKIDIRPKQWYNKKVFALHGTSCKAVIPVA